MLMKSNKSNEGIQLTNRTFVVPEKLFRAQSVADTIHRQIGSAKKKQQPKSTSSKHLGQPLPFTPPVRLAVMDEEFVKHFKL